MCVKNARFPSHRLKTQSHPGLEMSPLAGDGEAALTSRPARFPLSAAYGCRSFRPVRRRRQVYAGLSEGREAAGAFPRAPVLRSACGAGGGAAPGGGARPRRVLARPLPLPCPSRLGPAAAPNFLPLSGRPRLVCTQAVIKSRQAVI